MEGEKKNVEEIFVDFPPDSSAKYKKHVNIAILDPAKCPLKLNVMIPSCIFIRPEPVLIRASCAQVWEAYMDVKNTKYYNPFQRNIEIKTLPDGREKYIMHLSLPTILGGRLGSRVGCDIKYDDPRLSTTEENVLVKDEKRFIFCYGINQFVTQAMRIVYLTPAIQPNGEEWCVFNSYDTIQGFTGFVLKFLCVFSFFVKAFQGQHDGLKRWVEATPEEREAMIANTPSYHSSSKVVSVQVQAENGTSKI